MLKRDLGSDYNPLYFLASLGAGGLAVTFFLYPMFMVKHPDSPLVSFDHLQPLLTQGEPLLRALLVADLAAVAIFALLHFRLLWWNLSEYRRFRKTASFEQLRQSNSEVSLMAIPLTLAMSVNVLFILGTLFVPGLWSFAEYLFPVALVAYLATGIYALKILGAYFSRLFVNGGFDLVANNNLSQMIAIFALAMIAVGFAAPGAMSHIKTVNALGIFFSIFFLSLAVLLMVIKLVLGFYSMLQHGIDQRTSPSLWIVIPILTLIGITLIRLIMALHHGFHEPVPKAGLFVLTSVLLSLEILAGLIGFSVMRKLNYFRDYIHGPKGDAGSFALICPGVALFVFGFFFLQFGLVKNGLVAPLSLGYLLLLAPFVWIQIKTIQTFFRLSCRIMAFGPCAIRNPAQA
jgi:hypothetical protein